MSRGRTSCDLHTWCTSDLEPTNHSSLHANYGGLWRQLACNNLEVINSSRLKYPYQTARGSSAVVFQSSRNRSTGNCRDSTAQCAKVALRVVCFEPPY